MKKVVKHKLEPSNIKKKRRLGKALEATSMLIVGYIDRPYEEDIIEIGRTPRKIICPINPDKKASLV